VLRDRLSARRSRFCEKAKHLSVIVPLFQHWPEPIKTIQVRPDCGEHCLPRFPIDSPEDGPGVRIAG
jgi:hypothetical protein